MNDNHKQDGDPKETNGRPTAPLVEPKGPQEALKTLFEGFLTQIAALEDIIPVFSILIVGYQAKKNETASEFFQKYDVEEKDGKRIVEVPSSEAFRLSRVVRDLQKSARVDSVANTSLVIGVFSVYDAFLSDLLRYILSSRPDFGVLDEKEIKVAEVFKHETLDELRNHLVDQAVVNIMRESHSTQWTKLSGLFGCKELEEIDPEGLFVEASQRRNLLVHAGGRVSPQYLSEVRKAGYSWDTEAPRIGETLNVDRKYLLQTVRVVHNVGLRLGSLLVRKVLKDLKMSDELLADHLYNLCEEEDWERAVEVGTFALSFNNHSSSELKRRILVNFAQSLKWSGKTEECNETLDRLDWSDVSSQFDLAHAILTDDFDRADRILRVLSSDPDWKVKLVEWPLFREYRRRESFPSFYSELFGETFELPVPQFTARVERQIHESMQGLTSVLKQRKKKSEKNPKSSEQKGKC